MDWLVTESTKLGTIFWYLIQAVHWTILISVTSYLIAISLGLLVGLGRVSPSRPVQILAAGWVHTLRGVPLLVLIFFVYFGLGKVVNLDRFLAGVLAVGICYSAYLAEVIRNGISAVDQGQYEAAYSLGMTRHQTMRHVVLPQSVRVIVPPAANEFIACLKDSSLVSIIGLRELTRAGREYSSQTFLDFHTWLMVGLIYLALTLTLTRLVKKLEQRYAVRGFGAPLS